ncbi:MAG: DUF1330 domain-containing protein [Candidatus Puniceispirillaceae bacterium]
MPKGYMLSAHRSLADAEKADAYRALARPAMEAMGGRMLAATSYVVAKENGLAERTVLIEFESMEAAIAAYESAAYQEALAVLSGGADRDIRLFEGLE